MSAKFLRKWVDGGGPKVPGSLKELQQLLGKLLWASPFVPRYKELVAPIERLLSPKGSGEWTAECTSALNELLRVIGDRISLG